MSELTIPARKFVRLVDYFDQIGLDARAIAGGVGLVPERLSALEPDQPLPALQYSRLYKAGLTKMQEFRHPIPWAAGVGTEAFELMCHCAISARTLGEALALAARFDKLVYPMVGYNLRLLAGEGDDTVRLSYHINVPEDDPVFAPPHWDRAGYQATVARASGLKVWYLFCGWLTGHALEARQVSIQAPYLNREYFEGLGRTFNCPIQFDASENTFTIDRAELDRRIVHTSESLAEFLENVIYHLIEVDHEPASTSAAIKSLVSIDLQRGMPSFAEVADALHMSESSLRRRLQKENTSYQALKDAVRCEVAIDRLLHEDARVADIAELLGFTEPSSFVRSFKSWTGQTPKSYRERVIALGQPG